eukprot:UN05635
MVADSSSERKENDSNHSTPATTPEARLFRNQTAPINMNQYLNQQKKEEQGFYNIKKDIRHIGIPSEDLTRLKAVGATPVSRYLQNPEAEATPHDGTPPGVKNKRAFEEP